MGIIRTFRRVFDSRTDAQPAQSAAPDTKPVDIFECERCGTTFISRPDQCSECDRREFRNLGNFDSS